jgi:hypothetical protein
VTDRPVTETVKAMQLKTKAMAHVLIRNGAGHKLFEMDVHGVCIAVTTALDAEIKIEPDMHLEAQRRIQNATGQPDDQAVDGSRNTDSETNVAAGEGGTAQAAGPTTQEETKEER